MTPRGAAQTRKEAEEVGVFTGETTAHKPPYQRCKKRQTPELNSEITA